MYVAQREREIWRERIWRSGEREWSFPPAAGSQECRGRFLRAWIAARCWVRGRRALVSLDSGSLVQRPGVHEADGMCLGV